jgi:hypothetical protein
MRHYQVSSGGVIKLPDYDTLGRMIVDESGQPKMVPVVMLPNCRAMEWELAHMDRKDKVEPVWLEENRKRLERAAKVVAEIEVKEARRRTCESEIEVLDHESEQLAEQYQVIADEIDEAMTLTGIKRKKKPKVKREPRDPNAPAKPKGGRKGPKFVDRVMEMLYRDSGSYSIRTLAEDCDATYGSAGVAIPKHTRETGWLEKDGALGDWKLSKSAWLSVMPRKPARTEEPRHED